MALQKLPFIRSVQLALVDGRAVTPTLIFYPKGKKPLIGTEAREASPSPEFLIEDFKVELGRHDPDKITRRSTSSAITPRITAVGVAQDFFDTLLGKLESSLNTLGRPLPKNIIVAEPISLSGPNEADNDWLSNYRRSIRRAIRDRFDEIDFMPEPFAVFQYYRYGLRHPLIAEQRKHVALVLDFGGGTFDISVIETTKAGDVSQTGINSRPLAAKSLQIGGFYLNRLIAEDILFSNVDKSIKADVRKHLDFFLKNPTQNMESLGDLPEARQAFFVNYKRLLSEIERAKLSICGSIANWEIGTNLAGVAPFPISIPRDPLAKGGESISIRLDAAKIRDIFVEKLWKARLKDAIEKSINRAKSELAGQSISVVLFSGGSSNIKWLSKLFRRDLGFLIEDANVIELNENFQEIVAKGLATECARRFFTEGEGDFRAVTYNRLCLALRPDQGELEVRRARPSSDKLRAALLGTVVGTEDGVLLPSASAMKGMLDVPMVWRVKLTHPPKHQLEYFFLRSSFDPEDLEARHNIVSSRADTPSNTKFQQSIEVELTVREDGTAIPRFLYGRSDRDKGTCVEGEPFYIDMTFASNEQAGSTYLGLDFGSSSTTCSYVDSADVHLIDERNKAPEWRELSELLNELPYPVASPLARFMGEVDAERRSKCGRVCLEAMLTLGAYLAFADVCSVQSSRSSRFKNLAHRSAGPLWALLRGSLEAQKSNLRYSRPLLSLLELENIERINAAITNLASAKHDKIAEVDYIGILTLIGNCLTSIFSRFKLGIFEGVMPKRLTRGTYTGIFRVLDGSSQTFVKVFEYEGSEAFSIENVFVIDPAGGHALPLSPLYYWGLGSDASGQMIGDLYEFDTVGKGCFGFKTIQAGPELLVASDGVFKNVFDELADMRVDDPAIVAVDGLKFTDFDSSS